MRHTGDRTEATPQVERVIGRVHGAYAGPTLIVVGGIHGNEPAGVAAARRVCRVLEETQLPLSGDFVALTGNTRALARGVRYVDRDLNRHWLPENIPEPTSRGNGRSGDGDTSTEIAEDLELRELLAEIDAAVARARGETIVVDLHTTSGDGAPFGTIGDTLRNRRLALHFAVPIVLGLEEELQGTMLEYMNLLGHVTMGFEAGQHASTTSIDNHEAVIWTALVAAGMLRRNAAPDFARHHKRLAGCGSGAPRVFEIRYRHAVAEGDGFTMQPGFQNFQRVRRGQVLAHDRNGPVRAPEGGLLLMPLYQGLGDDGFFIGRSVKQLWLHVSAVLRRIHLARVVAVMPGVRHHPDDPDSLIVDTHVASKYPVEIFHLLGFRKRRWVGEQLIVTRRRHDMARGD